MACVNSCAVATFSAGTAGDSDGNAEEDVLRTVEVLQEATRLLAGVALRSVDVLGGAVTLPQYRVLSVLADLGEVRSARVADALGLEASTVTRLVDRLAASGHVVRKADPTNRSALMLELTSSGKSLVARVVSWRQGELERILLCLTPAERRELAKSLSRLVDVGAEGYGATSSHRLPL